MPHHRIVHGLGAEGAARLVREAFAVYAARFPQYHPTLTWEGPAAARLSLSAKGFKVGFHLLIGPEDIQLDAALPLPLRPLKARALAVIDREARRWIDEAQATARGSGGDGVG